jgi:hypothetical protein
VLSPEQFTPPLPVVPALSVSPAAVLGLPVSQVSSPTPPATPLMALLRSQQGMATAVMLQEILGPPKSRRRR